MAKESKKESNRGFITVLSATILIIVFGFIFFQDKLKTKEHFRRLEKAIYRPTTIEVELVEMNNSGITGNVIITDLHGYTYVTARLDGVDDQLAKPMNIRSGTCDDLGEVVYPLVDAINSKSLSPPLETTLGVMATQMPLAINVHTSVREAGISAACGNIPPFLK